MRFSFLTLLLVCLVAAGLRVSLSLVNREANDDHMEVVELIRDQRRIPVRADCMQCYHPKLFHAAGALLLMAAGAEGGARFVLLQLLNTAAGLLTLWIVFLFLKETDGLREPARLLFFSLIALNPKLAAINAQVTNDSFAILFCSAALLFLRRCLRGGGWKPILWCSAFLSLAGVAKGTALPVVFTTAAVLGLRVLSAPPGARRLRAAQAAAFLGIFLAVAPFFGQYAGKYLRDGSPFVTNHEKDRPPRLFEESYEWRSGVRSRPGVLSVFSAYFTFRFGDMLRTPMQNNQVYRYPLHRTSFWSCIFGRTFFARFDCWPPSWRTHEPWVLRLGRALLVLGLIPACLLFFGGLEIVSGALRRIREGLDPVLDWEASSVLLVLVSFCFLIAYTCNYRDFSTAKAVFFYPGLLGFLSLLIRGATLFRPYPALERVLGVCLIFLCVLSIADAASIATGLAFGVPPGIRDF